MHWRGCAGAKHEDRSRYAQDPFGNCAVGQSDGPHGRHGRCCQGLYRTVWRRCLCRRRAMSGRAMSGRAMAPQVLELAGLGQAIITTPAIMTVIIIPAMAIAGPSGTAAGGSASGTSAAGGDNASGASLPTAAGLPEGHHRPLSSIRPSPKATNVARIRAGISQWALRSPA